VRFVYHGPEIECLPKLSVDGTVSNAVHLSHWKGNRTPAALKADTSTEIALNFVASPDRDAIAGGTDLVTNNHFDADGALSVWTVLEGPRALALRDRLVAAAAAGDFAEMTTADGVRAALAIQGSDDPTDHSGSPLARRLARRAVDDDAEAYALVLPQVERLLLRTDDYEPLWREAWDRIVLALESFDRGESTVEEHPGGVSLVTLAAHLHGPGRLDPARHATPFTAVSANARGRLYVLARPLRDGWAYRIDWPYWSWAETVVRPTIVRADLGPALARLSDLEGPDAPGRWVADPSELSSAAKLSDSAGAPAPSRLSPDVVAREVSAALAASTVSASSRT
jgi:hypothetical protein